MLAPLRLTQLFCDHDMPPGMSLLDRWARQDSFAGLRHYCAGRTLVGRLGPSLAPIPLILLESHSTYLKSREEICVRF